MINRPDFVQTRNGADVSHVDSLVVPVKKAEQQFLAFIFQQSPYLLRAMEKYHTFYRTEKGYTWTPRL
jgi:hypothetical protein